ncbi:membrane protein [Bacillus phage Chotacabras]|nr:membrane protein [Bacillus phage Chotacabras]
MTLSTTYLVLLACLGASVLIKYTENLRAFVLEVKAIKEKGDTPLTLQTASCIGVGFAVELGTSTGLVYLLSRFVDLTPDLWVVASFIIIYLIRNVLAYLVVWGYWAIIVQLGKKKVKQELLTDIGEED